MRKVQALLACVAMLGTVSFGAAPALANGCNGVVEWWTWGCAPWDNNNGPKFKYFKKSTVTVPIPAGGLKVEVKDNQAYAVVNGQKMPVANGVQGLVAAGGGNLVAAGGGNLVAAGGGNIAVIQNGN